MAHGLGKAHGFGTAHSFGTARRLGTAHSLGTAHGFGSTAQSFGTAHSLGKAHGFKIADGFGTAHSFGTARSPDIARGFGNVGSFGTARSCGTARSLGMAAGRCLDPGIRSSRDQPQPQEPPSRLAGSGHAGVDWKLRLHTKHKDTTRREVGCFGVQGTFSRQLKAAQGKSTSGTTSKFKATQGNSRKIFLKVCLGP